MADPKIGELQRVGLFARCSKPELLALAKNTDEVDLPAGRTLVVEGKSNDTFYVLLEGTLEVQIKGRRRRRLNAVMCSAKSARSTEGRRRPR